MLIRLTQIAIDKGKQKEYEFTVHSKRIIGIRKSNPVFIKLDDGAIVVTESYDQVMFLWIAALKIGTINDELEADNGIH